MLLSVGVLAAAVGVWSRHLALPNWSRVALLLAVVLLGPFSLDAFRFGAGLARAFDKGLVFPVRPAIAVAERLIGWAVVLALLLKEFLALLGL